MNANVDFVEMQAILKTAIHALDLAKDLLPPFGERQLEEELIQMRNNLVAYRLQIRKRVGLPL